jgi:hypothetical protein
MMRILAGVFAICAAGCAFDTTGTPSPYGSVDAVQSVTGTPDAAPTPPGTADAPPATIDAAPPGTPDACVGKRCGGGGGPGSD